MFFYEDDRENIRQIEVAVATLADLYDQTEGTIDKLFAEILDRFERIDKQMNKFFEKQPVAKKKPGRKKKVETKDG